MEFLPWEIRIAFPGESQLRQGRATQPTIHAGCFSVFRIHRTLTWTTGSLRWTQMLMHAIAHGGVRTPQERLHWKLTVGEKSLTAPRNRTCIDSLPVRCSTNWLHPQAAVSTFCQNKEIMAQGLAVVPPAVTSFSVQLKEISITLQCSLDMRES